jgi:hypothetical protein
MQTIDETERAVKVLDEQMHISNNNYREDSYSILRRADRFMQQFEKMRNKKCRQLDRLYKKVEKLRYKIG